jgi:hypothetical protein
MPLLGHSRSQFYADELLNFERSGPTSVTSIWAVTSSTPWMAVRSTPSIR